jgi:hypothetical protein
MTAVTIVLLFSSLGDRIHVQEEEHVLRLAPWSARITAVRYVDRVVNRVEAKELQKLRSRGCTQSREYSHERHCHQATVRLLRTPRQRNQSLRFQSKERWASRKDRSRVSTEKGPQFLPLGTRPHEPHVCQVLRAASGVVIPENKVLYRLN